MSVIVAYDRRPFTPAAGGFEVTWGIRPGSQEMRLVNCGDLRDRKAITRLATGFLKLLFPDMKPAEEEFKEFCVKPAVELRQRVRDELHKMDPEYAKVSIGYE